MNVRELIERMNDRFKYDKRETRERVEIVSQIPLEGPTERYRFHFRDQDGMPGAIESNGVNGYTLGECRKDATLVTQVFKIWGRERTQRSLEFY